LFSLIGQPPFSLFVFALFGDLSQYLLRGHLHHHFKEFVSRVGLELFSGFLSDLDGVFDGTLLFDHEFLASVGHGDQSPEHDLSVNDAGLSGNGCLAVSVEGFEEGTLAVDTDVGVHVVEGVDVFEGSLVVLSALDTDGSLCDGGKHLVPFEDRRGVFVHVHSLQSGDGQERGIDDAVVQFSETGLDVSSEVDAFQCWVLGEDLGLSAERGGSDDGSVGEFGDGFVFVVFCDESIVGVLAGEIARKDGPLGQPGRDVLHGVNADVDFVSEEGNVEFLGEKSLSSQFHERLIEDHVTLCLHDANFDGTVFVHFLELLLEASSGFEGLCHGQGRSPGSDSEGLDFGTIFGEKGLKTTNKKQSRSIRL